MIFKINCFVLIIFPFFIFFSTATFCNIRCEPTSCNDHTSSTCTACPSSFVLATPPSGPSACNFNGTPLNQQLSKVLTNGDFDVGVGSESCGVYNFKGKIGSTGSKIIDTDNPITTPHYQVKAVFWLILIDRWNVSPNEGDFIDIDQITTSQTTRVNASSFDLQQDVCTSGFNLPQKFIRYQWTFPHTSTTNDVKFNFKPSAALNTNYGIDDILLIIKKCHSYCDACTGPTNAQCSSCSSTYVLSGTTCDTNCLPGYGPQSSSVCVLCNVYCLTCQNTATNCPTCQTSVVVGTVTTLVYKVQGSNQCVDICPTGKLIHITTCVNNCPSEYGPDTTSTNCVLCDSYCLTCLGTATNCQTCKTLTPTTNLPIYYVDGMFSCVTTCSDPYYATTVSGVNYCKLCDPQCLQCSVNPSNCTICAATVGATSTQVYKVEDQNSCVINCPTGYFSSLAQAKCLLCSIHCVSMVITNSQINGGSAVQFTFTFTAPIDFAGFVYTDFTTLTINDPTLSLTTDFIIIYTQVDTSSFKLTVQLAPSTNFEDIQICTVTKPQSSTLLQTALNRDPLSTNIYSVSSCREWSAPLQYFLFNKDEIALFYQLQTTNNDFEEFKTQKGTQQLFKSGVFSLFVPGAQLSSTLILHQPTISRNLYEGLRFWGSFVYFDVPKFEEPSEKTKFVFQQPSNQLIKNNQVRLLQTPSSQYLNEWRFQRTGHTGFFIFDTYLQIFLIGICWIIYGIGWYYQKKKNAQKSKAFRIRSKINAVFHKIHEMSFFYLVLAALVQYKNFTSSALHFVSVIFSFIFLFYYLCYELKIYWDLLQYPIIKVKTPLYYKIVKRYSFFLAYYRFEEYKDKQIWNWRHFFRPYNYHTLTFIKKASMLICIPIFYDYPLTSILILMILQILDVIRFILTVPYHKKIRNYVYFTLEASLMIYFICGLVNLTASSQIHDSSGVIINLEAVQMYKSSGWIGLFFLYLYNSLFMLSSFVQLVYLIFVKFSLQKLVWSNRYEYYLQLFDHFQQYGSYYRLLKNYTEELQYNMDRKQGNKFIDWVNRFHNAQPITDLSGQKYKVFKDIVERGDLFAIDQNDENSMQKIIQIRIEIFTINHIKRKLFIDIDIDDEDMDTPKNIDSNFPNDLNRQSTKSTKDYLKQSTKTNQNARSSISSMKKQQPQFYNFQINYNIITSMLRNQQTQQNEANNLKQIKILNRIKNTIKSQKLNKHFQKHLNNSLLPYIMPGTDEIKLTTFLKIDLNQYQKGQRIALKRQNMRQQIQSKINGKRHKIQLKNVLDRFPIDWNQLEKINQSISSNSVVANSNYAYKNKQTTPQKRSKLNIEIQ